MKSVKLHLTIEHSKIAWLTFLLEAYEGLALVRTINPAEGRVVLLIGPGNERDVAAFLDAVGDEIGLVKGLSDDYHYLGKKQRTVEL